MQHVAVIAIGGLGHLAVQFGGKIAASCTAISTSDSKKKLCLEKLGATAFVNSRNADELAAVQQSFDFVLTTAAYDGDINALIDLLKPHGTLAVVGMPEEDLHFDARKLAGFGCAAVR